MFRNADFGKAFDVDAAVQAVSDFFAVFIHAMQGVEDRRHDRDRAEARIVQHFVVEFFRAGSAVNGQRHRNHVGLFVEDAENAGVAILHKDSGALGGVDDLEGVERRGQRGQHLRLVHGQIDGAELQQRMSAGQQALRIDIGDGAGGGDVHDRREPESR